MGQKENNFNPGASSDPARFCWNCQHMKPSLTGGGGWCLEESNRTAPNLFEQEGVPPSILRTGTCDKFKPLEVVDGGRN